MEPENQNTPQAASPSMGGGKSKKGIYILIAVIVVIVFAKGAMGRFMHSAYGVDMHQVPNGGTTYSTEQGSVTVGATKLPDNWPSDAPTYANAQIQSAVSSNPADGQKQSAVVFTTSDSVQAVSDFYSKALVTNGWKVEQTVTSTSGTVLAATKDTRTFGVYIAASSAGQTTVTTSVTSK